MIGRILKTERVEQVSQPARFLIVGAVNTLFGYGMYLAGLVIGVRPTLSLAIATLVGGLFNYVSTARFVFRHNTLERLPVFISAYVVIYILNAGAIVLLMRAGLSPAVAQAVMLPLAAALSFLLFRRFVFTGGQPR